MIKTLNDMTICHHGVRGQRWGRRRYQNPDGSLTELGRARLAKQIYKEQKKEETVQNKKNKIVRTVDEKAFRKNLSSFTDAEIQAFANRKRAMESLNKDGKSDKDIIDRATKVVDKATQTLSTYNKAAKLVNDISGEDTLPTFDKAAALAKANEQKKKAREAYLKKVSYKDIAENWSNFSPAEMKALGEKATSYERVEKLWNNKKPEWESKEAERVIKEFYDNMPASDFKTYNSKTVSDFVSNYSDTFMPISQYRDRRSTLKTPVIDALKSTPFDSIATAETPEQRRQRIKLITHSLLNISL